jgi:hypothetical protein
LTVILIRPTFTRTPEPLSLTDAVAGDHAVERTGKGAIDGDLCRGDGRRSRPPESRDPPWCAARALCKHMRHGRIRKYHDSTAPLLE